MYVHDASIVYTARDRELAASVFLALDGRGTSVFLAAVTNYMGESGAALVNANLRASRWPVLLLASAAACEYLETRHKRGVACLSEVRYVTVALGAAETELPAWVDRRYVLSLGDDVTGRARGRVEQLAGDLGAEAGDGAAIFGTMLEAFVGRAAGRGAT